MLVLLFLILMGVRLEAQNFETGDNSTVVGCSNHCSIDDNDLHCWNKTLAYYERLLLAEMKHFVAVEINIDQWYKRHMSHLHRNFTALIADQVERLSALVDDKDIINSTTISVVVNALMSLVQIESAGVLSRMPHFSCPLPCEYRYTIWRNVFIASCFLNILLLLIVIPFIRMLIKKDSVETLMY